MDDFIESYGRFYLDGLRENGGDIWDIYARVLQYTIHWIDEQGLVEIVENMMRGSQFADQMANGAFRMSEIEEANRTYVEEMYGYVDRSCCMLSREEFDELLRLHVATLVIALKRYYAEGQRLEEITVSYQRCMKLLQYGACPKCQETEIKEKEGQKHE